MRERSCVLPENVLHFVTGDKMLLKYVSVFLLSMVPVLELRGAIPGLLGQPGYLCHWQYAARACDLFLCPEGTDLGRR